jgi:hypothetical protein
MHQQRCGNPGDKKYKESSPGSAFVPPHHGITIVSCSRAGLGLLPLATFIFLAQSTKTNVNVPFV